MTSVAPLTRSVDWNQFISYKGSVCFSRSSHEERGLKYFALYHLTMHLLVSLLSRGAWIEIMSERNINLMSSSLLSRGAWIEIFRLAFLAVKSSLSLLSRGAWIEIGSGCDCFLQTVVAPLTRSVDWNIVVSDALSKCIRRSSHEERGLKSPDLQLLRQQVSRSSHEERGLKSVNIETID